MGEGNSFSLELFSLEVEISFPSKNLQMMTNSLQKKFSRVHDHQIVEVLVMKESQNDFKLEFKFTGSDAKIKAQVTETLSDFATAKTQITFEDHPMIQELMTNTSAICNTLRTKSGYFRVDDQNQYQVSQGLSSIFEEVNAPENF